MWKKWIFCIDVPVFKIITVFEKKTTFAFPLLLIYSYIAFFRLNLLKVDEKIQLHHYLPSSAKNN